eukprot:2909870-Rhodomonas_salina.2
MPGANRGLVPGYLGTRSRRRRLGIPTRVGGVARSGSASELDRGPPFERKLNLNSVHPSPIGVGGGAEQLALCTRLVDAVPAQLAGSATRSGSGSARWIMIMMGSAAANASSP